MYKPSLKRIEQTNHQPTAHQQHITYIHTNQNTNLSSFVAPIKLVNAPSPPINNQSSLFAPLMASPNKYPTSIQKLISLDNNMTKVFGSYQHINWLQTHRHVHFWTNNMSQSKEYTFDGPISCVTMGQLRASNLAARIRSTFILCVGVKNQVSIFGVDKYGLKVWQTDLKYCLQYSLQVQSIKIINEDKLVLCSDTGCNMIVTFQNDTPLLKTFTPLYKRLVPIQWLQRRRRVQNVIYTQNKLFILSTLTKRKSWLQNAIQSIIQETEPTLYTIRNFIEVYSFQNHQIKLTYTINQEELTQKTQSYIPNNQLLQISNISLNSSDNDEELVAVTTTGLIITLKYTDRVYLTKTPYFMPNISNLYDCPIISSKPLSKLIDQTSTNQILHTLGPNNLSLKSQNILLYNSHRIDAISHKQLKYQLIQHHQSHTPLNSQSWILFTQTSYYELKQLPIKDMVITAIFIAHIEVNQSLPSTYHSYQFKAFMERMQAELKPDNLLRVLIEIIISNQPFISINSIAYNLIHHELKGLKAKHYRHWEHHITPDITSKIIPICQTITNKAWNLLLTLQLKELPSLQQKRHISDRNMFWSAVHQLYYDMVSPILQFVPSMFKKHFVLVDKVFKQLKKLNQFIMNKMRKQLQIRQSSSSNYGSNERMNKQQSLLLLQPFGHESKEEMKIIVEKEVAEMILSKNVNQEVVQLHQCLQNTIAATLNFISIYSILIQNQQKLPTFKQTITSPHHQTTIARAIVSLVNLQILQEIYTKMPYLNLKRDISFLSKAQKIKQNRISIQVIDIEQLGLSVSSSYFKTGLSMLNDRYDVWLKVLQVYEGYLVQQKGKLIKKDSLKQRHYLNNSLFSEEQQMSLNFKRQYLQEQLQNIATQRRELLSSLLRKYKENADQNSKIMDELIMMSLSRPAMFEHLVLCFEQNDIRDDRYVNLLKRRYKNANKNMSVNKNEGQDIYRPRQIFSLE